MKTLLRQEFDTARIALAEAAVAVHDLRFHEAAQHVRTLRAVSEVMLDLLDSIADSSDSPQGDSDDGKIARASSGIGGIVGEDNRVRRLTRWPDCQRVNVMNFCPVARLQPPLGNPMRPVIFDINK